MYPSHIVTDTSYAVAETCLNCALQKACNAPVLYSGDHYSWPDTKSPALVL